MQDTGPEILPDSKGASPPDDSTLVQRCLDGDQRAWNLFVDRYSRLIYSVARHYGLSEQDASDVLQNVLIITLKNLHQLKHQERLSAWLIAIAHRETLRCLRGNGKGGIADPQVTEDERPALTDELRQIESSEILRQAMNRLGPIERQLLVALLDDPPPSYDELAARLQIPRGSIGFWRKRAIERLKTILQELSFFG